MAEIKNYNIKYKEDVRRVCINTGPSTAKTNQKVHDFILLTFCDYYVEQEPENVFVLVDENDVAQGYVFGARDFDEYFKKFRKYLKRIRREGISFYFEALGEAFLHKLYSKKYPAHLHIDINADFRGSGNGSRMIATLTEHMKAQGAPGIMLVVGSQNTRGIAFYQKNGFKIIRSIASGTIMAKEL